MVKLSMIALIPLILFAQISLAAPVNGPSDTYASLLFFDRKSSADVGSFDLALPPPLLLVLLLTSKACDFFWPNSRWLNIDFSAGQSGIQKAVTKIKKCLGIKCPVETGEFPMWQP
jgi:hypothetical protein